MNRRSMNGLVSDFLFELAEKILRTLSMGLTEAIRVIVIGLIFWITQVFLQLLFPLTAYRTAFESISFLFLVALWMMLVTREIVREIGYARREYEDTRIYLAPRESRTLTPNEPTPVLRRKDA
jgi:hypothetical protein